MAGHSKWANIRHRKERQDSKRSKVWSKCSKAIMAAARSGGADPDTNLRLRYAIDEAKYANMPKDTIKRAVEKGAGAGDGDAFQEIVYEGYGPGGTAVLIETLTDNNTRTVNDLRNCFKKAGGSLGTSGSVAYLFDTRGQIFIECSVMDEDAMMEMALESGAEELETPDDPAAEGAMYTIVTDPTTFSDVKTALEAALADRGLDPEETIKDATIAKVPQNTVDVAGDDVRKVMNLIDLIEDNDDVQKVYTNADFSEEELANL